MTTKYWYGTTFPIVVCLALGYGCAVPEDVAEGRFASGQAVTRMFIIDFASEASALNAAGLGPDGMDLGGIDGANAMCQQRARAAGLSDPENYIAFLSSRSGLAGGVDYDFYQENADILDLPIVNAFWWQFGSDRQAAMLPPNSPVRTLNDLRRTNRQPNSSWDQVLFYRADGTRPRPCEFRTTTTWEGVTGMNPDGTPVRYSTTCRGFTSNARGYLSQTLSLFDRRDTTEGPDGTSWTQCRQTPPVQASGSVLGNYRTIQDGCGGFSIDGLVCVSRGCERDEAAVARLARVQEARSEVFAVASDLQSAQPWEPGYVLGYLAADLRGVLTEDGAFLAGLDPAVRQALQRAVTALQEGSNDFEIGEATLNDARAWVDQAYQAMLALEASLHRQLNECTVLT